MSEPLSKHDALMAASEGYREFIAEQLDSDPESDLYLEKGFADWSLTCAGEAEERAAWTADQWRDRWDFWNS